MNSAEGVERPPLGVPVSGHVPAQEGLEGQAPGLAPVEYPGLQVRGEEGQPDELARMGAVGRGSGTGQLGLGLQ